MAHQGRMVPAGFILPVPIATDMFRLALLGPEHHDSDYIAWTSSMDFIRSLPGWESSAWPTPMTPEDNLADCVSHLRRSLAGHDFAYTVLLPLRDDVIGCVFFKLTDPPRDGAVNVLSWVTAEYRHLDKPVYDAVTLWLGQAWPWHDVHYAPR